MLLTAATPGYQVFDCVHRPILGVSEYNTETREITVALRVGATVPGEKLRKRKVLLMPDPDLAPGVHGCVPVFVTFTLPGSYARDPQGDLVK